MTSDSPVFLPLQMAAQPDDRSCGPTCLQAVYRFFGREVPLGPLIDDIDQLGTGGTLAVQLGVHALRNGFDATIYTYNLQLFDPTWFLDGSVDLSVRLAAQARHKASDERLDFATSAYLEFLSLGGKVTHAVLQPSLIEERLREGLPILTGLSSTYLYEASREIPELDRADDVRGEPVGHFVVLCGYDSSEQSVTLADPWPLPDHEGHLHVRPLYRVLSSILLGVLTYDANLLVLRPRDP